MGAGSRATLDAEALLDLVERGWSLRLRGRSLAAEAEPEQDVVEAVARALGQLHAGAARADVARRWPACVVLALVGTFARDHEQGSPWRCWWRACGRRRPTPRDAAQWGRATREALAALGLATFPELDPGEALLLHTGVPDAHLDELWRLLADGPDVASQAAPGTPPALLLHNGGAAARPLLDQCRELLRALDAGHEPPEGGPPERFTVRAVELSARGALAAGTADAGPEPDTFLEPFGRGLLLQVPGCWADAEVMADDRRLTISPPVGPAPVGPAPAGPEAEGGHYAVPNPTAALSVSSAGRRWTLPPAWSRRLPLAFDEDGRPLPEAAPLPPDPVWLLHPDDSVPTADVPLRTLAYSRMPLGWAGWQLVQVSLEDVSWLWSPEDGATRRLVKGRARPRLVTGDPVAGLHTEGGRPVYGHPPALWLPAGTADWQVEIRRPGEPALVRHTLAPGDTAALWQGLPRPLLGEYTVRVRGAAGRGLQRTVALAEGLEAPSHPAVRLLHERGLEPAEVLLRPVAGMTAAPSALAYDPATASRGVDLVVREVSWRLTVTPPRMRAAVDGLPEGGEGPLCLDPDRLAAAEPLRIDLPGARRAPVLELLADGRTVQTLEPYRDGSYNLRRLLDTAAAHPGATLAFTYEGRRALVARLDTTHAPAADPWLPAGP
ncbi:hypothetical protein [Actinacidiphila soli]|uniref:hypothetical protein n=1 Tax=Actinacidiphila soli TaxID=2487275 RepID=UPI000FCA8F09|nr:hypothetical protein [Actinacidiphila soli]